MPDETALAQQEPVQPAVRRYALKTAAPARKGLVDYDRDLSDEQRAVALCDARPTLVIAGAGSVNRESPSEEVSTTEVQQSVGLEAEILRAARSSAERKAQMNAMDFDDLLLNWKRLLVEVPAARESICRRFSAVLVDEYQDTNRLQGEIVDATAAPHGNVLVVGDDAQSIYAFRGAHFENILRFPEDHPLQRAPGEGPGVARRVPHLARRRALSQRARAARTGWRRRGAAPVLRRGHACQGRAVPDVPDDAGGARPGAAALATEPVPRRAARGPAAIREVEHRTGAAARIARRVGHGRGSPAGARIFLPRPDGLRRRARPSGVRLRRHAGDHRRSAAGAQLHLLDGHRRHRVSAAEAGG